MEENKIIFTKYPNVISGVDTMFYFYESNSSYDKFYSNLLKQLENNRKVFDDKDISYENRDLKVMINNHVFEYNGKAQGFYWFTHLDNYMKVGFKDSSTNTSSHNIQVQFLSLGI